MRSSTSNGNRGQAQAPFKAQLARNLGLPPLARRRARADQASRHCLPGATAAQALLGRDFRVTKHRGEVVIAPMGEVVPTFHPAAVLRAPDPEARLEMRQALFDDLVLGGRLTKNR